MGHTTWISGAVAAVVTFAWPSAFAQTIFVSATPTGGAGDGSSWSDAYVGSDGLHAALASATPGSEIWITAGT